MKEILDEEFKLNLKETLKETLTEVPNGEVLATRTVTKIYYKEVKESVIKKLVSIASLIADEKYDAVREFLSTRDNNSYISFDLNEDLEDIGDIITTLDLLKYELSK